MEPNAEPFPQEHDDDRALPLDQQEKKTQEIHDACKWKDVDRLKALATSEGGLISDQLRRLTWPLLLGEPSQSSDTEREKGDREDWKQFPEHRDEGQVQLDVNRSFIYYPNNQSSRDLDQKKEELSNLITEVLRRQPYLCYFQGYHDICQVFLLVLEPPRRAVAVSRLSTLRIRDFMLPTLTPALAQLRLIPAILYAVNPKLYHHLSETQPFFALSGTLTMYAHDIQEYGDIARLFDVFLAREAVFPVYMFAQIVLKRSDELFETPADEPEMLHSILSKLPKPLDLEALIQGTVKLIEKHPPETLKPWRSISSSSVMKTALRPNQVLSQSLEDGKAYFERQVKELERAEQRDKVLKTLWRYRKPAQTVGLAVLIGLVSFWARKTAIQSDILGSLWSRLSHYSFS
ncbi:hypothetical protein HYALB_00005575 [Hymenoscyphus albidus]|uniref:Rab-GAP TBC domain-containing protein n=1 Tax=Hymenoscyphus albidus TaxID=595503 RepID=A0A9N9PZF7_9HELO|nr:hypothetical protein HYALB_00005575 [Hymenoscyphus albidus]